MTNKKYKAIKKRLNLTDSDVAQMFGYKNATTMRNSSKYDTLKNGLAEFYQRVFKSIQL